MRSPPVLSIALLLLAPAFTAAQQAPWQSDPSEDLRRSDPAVHALTGARVVVEPGVVIEEATIVIRDGRIEAVGPEVGPPADARVWNLSGHTIYAGFIDAHADLELEENPASGAVGRVHWNPQLRAHFSAGDAYRSPGERLAALRAQGFTTAHAVPRLGIFRGRTAIVSLGTGPAREQVLRESVAQSVSFSRSTALGNTYPNSPMGAIAFIRQGLHDADWYRRAHVAFEADPQRVRRPESNAALAALGPAARGEHPLVFEVVREEEFFRTLRIAEGFGTLLPWIRGSGHEYRIVDEIAAAGVPLIIPLAFPERPSVELPEQALDVSLAELRHWHLAPGNPARLAEAGVPFSLTTAELDSPSRFLPNLRLAVDRGLDPDIALAALTTTPAELLGLERSHGTVATGRNANLVVVDGDLFHPDGVIRDVWIDGIRYEIEPAPRVDPRGEWLLVSNDDPGLSGRLLVDGRPGSLRASFELESDTVALRSPSAAAETGRLRASLPGEALGLDGTVRLSSSVSGDEMHGWAEYPDGRRPAWRAERVAGWSAAEDDGSDGSDGSDVSDVSDNGGASPPRSVTVELDLGDIRPAMEYGRAGLPERPDAVLVRNATIWTQGPQGRLENADLLVEAGLVSAVGSNLTAPAGAVVIDAAGRHVTPGLIDAHLHSGTHGVNESGHAIVPEVRMADVVTHNNIWMYRQLAGGLTTAHVKHGSANPIGGQNVFVKMRWGALPHELELEEAPRTVKFALGENPKRNPNRYPDTRMGVAEMIRDYFEQALDYERAWTEWDRTGAGLPPRRDLRMEALVEILNGEIGISSHGYRQDEFLALVRLAEEYGFSVQTLQHGVEAYKIAPELAASGVAAVVWSDWSSFKIEAYDATTYNARILTEAGVLTSLHSDNSQIATRMNWEAAKMLRTGMSEEEALALVTSNTARVLRIDHRVGSLEPGKDADFVIWSGHPLSQFTVAEQTWVDGRRYFDLEEDRAARQRVEEERSRLIQAALEDR